MRQITKGKNVANLSHCIIKNIAKKENTKEKLIASYASSIIDVSPFEYNVYIAKIPAPKIEGIESSIENFATSLLSKPKKRPNVIVTPDLLVPGINAKH